MNVSQLCALVSRKADDMLGCFGRVLAAGDPSHLLSTGETTSAVLCPVLGYPVQDRYGHTGSNPVKGYENGE